MTADEERALRAREALLAGALREIFRIADAAEAGRPDGESIPPSEAYVGAHGRAWRSIEKKARRLVGA